MSKLQNPGIMVFFKIFFSVVFRLPLLFLIGSAFIPDAKIHVFMSGGAPSRGPPTPPDFFIRYGIFGLGGIGEEELMGGWWY